LTALLKGAGVFIVAILIVTAGAGQNHAVAADQLLDHLRHHVRGWGLGLLEAGKSQHRAADDQ